MEILKTEKTVTIKYSNDIGVRYEFKKPDLFLIKRTSAKISMNEQDRDAEKLLAQSMLKSTFNSVSVTKPCKDKIVLEEVVTDDSSLKTVFDFNRRKIAKFSQDNSVGEEKINISYNFREFQNGSDKQKLMFNIAESAKRLIRKPS